MIGWILLAAGLSGLAIALTFDERSWDEHREAARQILAQQDELRRRHTPAPVAPPSAPELRARQAYREARAPWLETLRAIESSSQDPVFLRSLTIAPADRSIKLEAEATTFADALAYVEALDAAPSLHPAMLVSHEQSTDPANGKGLVRFAVLTSWNQP